MIKLLNDKKIYKYNINQVLIKIKDLGIKLQLLKLDLEMIIILKFVI